MGIETEIAKLKAILMADYIFSGESERIQNPERNEDKYRLLLETWAKCYQLAEAYKGKLEGNDPDFPMCCHLIKLVLPTENDEIIIREIKSNLSDAINNADEINIDTDIKGNVQIHFGFEDVYTPREA